MSGVAVKGLDSAGGEHLGGGQSAWTINGAPIILLGDPVKGHGNSPHSSPTMVEASGWFSIGGVPVVMAGNKASCGHPSTGRPNFNVPA